ncbi:NAD(P)/FAD-dependent oxidoreductase [Actinoplanes sp. CA-142083]|uniref:NAD(P)/FAD-dependent oxidoreductase n=1 Tax=Actinoplanes sp. CA-142083 TaxID=3239903 RepID=UPI003D8C9F2E
MDDRAIVIGAGVAGLAAARVLSRRYASVTVLDRDTLPYGPVPRRGVPQSEHPHILLVAGVREFSMLFPAFERELVSLGGTVLDTGADICSYRLGGRWPATPTGLTLISVSRPQLEAVLRARVTALPGVAVHDQVAVAGLAGRGDLVTGVVLDSGETLAASLVVDCSGRGSRSDRWLGSLGLPPPEQVEVKVGVSYSTRLYRRRPGDLGPWQAAVSLPAGPYEWMSAVAMPIEGDRWMIGLGGWHLADPPASAEAFEAYAKQLPDPLFADLISRSEPLSDVLVARFPSSRRRLFEQAAQLPGGYVALGDAVCSFNPIYGQGMTCAARQATALGDVLDRHKRVPDPAMVREYYAAVAKINETPWRFAVGGDFAFPGTTGPRPRGIALRNWYARQVTYASQLDPDVYRVATGVQHLVTPPSELFRPGFAAKVIRLARKRHDR